MRHLLAPIWFTAFIACNGDEPADAPGARRPTTPQPTPTIPVVTTPAGYVRLDPLAHLARASIAIRGVRPSVDEIRALEAELPWDGEGHPPALERLVDQWLLTDSFGATVKDMHAEMLQVRADVIDPLPALGPLEGELMYDMSNSLMEEPLELVRDIVMSDRPYTEIVTADYILADSVLARVYGLDYDDAAGGWQVTRWSDGRPHAGVLTSSELWRRHESAGSNHHRVRANLLADKLLCADFATRDITVEGGITISDEFEVAAAVMTDPLCISCHQALDPLASSLFGFKKQIKRSTVSKSYVGKCDTDHGEDPLIPYSLSEFCYPLKMYNPEDEDWWEYWALRPPGYYGTPVNDLEDIGREMAEDPRFGMCAARRFYGYLAQTDPLKLPLEQVVPLRDAFAADGWSARTLVKQIVLSEPFAALGTVGEPSIPAAGLRPLRPEQLARTVHAITGFEWWVNPDLKSCTNGGNEGPSCWGKVDLMTSDFYGFRAMAGGVNGFQITVPTATFTPPRELVMERFVSEASGYVVRNDFDQPDRSLRRLFTSVDETTVDDAAVRAQIAALMLPVQTRDVPDTDPEIDALHAMWTDKLARSGSARDAWSLVLTAIFLDPRAVTY